MDSFIILTIALCAGLSIFLIAWLITRLVAEVPEQDRTWYDPPPSGFRLVWWPIQWISHYVAPLLSDKRRENRLNQMRQAGLDFMLNPDQFLSSRVIWGLICALFACWLVSTLKHDLAQANFSLMPPFIGFILGFYYPIIWLNDKIKYRRNQMIKTLPFYLDIITLCVESGLNLNGALQQAVNKGPVGVLRDEFGRVLRDIRAGSPRAEALRAMAQRLNHPAISSFTSSLIQAESTGMSLGPILRSQADQRRNERFTLAEKIAMEAPVKMLFPLIGFIFPCVFIILLFPIVMKFMDQGM